MINRISIILVVYDKEVPELLFCLKSIEALYDLTSLDKVYIAVQGQSSLVDQIDQLCKYHLQGLYEFIVMVTQADMLGAGAVGHGWYVQQALKLKVASLARTDFSLVLDCKNHFINRTSSEDFVRNSIPLYSLTNETETLQRNQGTLAKSFKTAHDIFNLDYSNYIDKSLGPVTPFVFSRKHVTDLLLWLERSYLVNFSDLFLNSLDTSEFYLYSAFLRYQGLFESSVAFRDDKVSRLVWEANVDDINYIQWIQSLRDSCELKIFGIHKNAYGKITERVMTEIQKLWKSSNLDPEVCDYLAKVSSISVF